MDRPVKKSRYFQCPSPRGCGGGMPGVGPVATVAGLTCASTFAVPLSVFVHLTFRFGGTLATQALGVRSTGGFFCARGRETRIDQD